MTLVRPHARIHQHPAGVARRPVSGNPAPRRPGLETEIGEHLRRHYASLLSEPIPDRFVELLRRLDQRRGDA
jgi:Anti-sigma factor NepR